MQYLCGRTDEDGRRKLSGWNFGLREVVTGNTFCEGPVSFIYIADTKTGLQRIMDRSMLLLRNME